MKTITLTFLIVVMSALSGCGLRSNSDVSPAVSVDCREGIRSFNSGVSESIRMQIQSVYNKQGKIPEQLKKYYPNARDMWNKELNNIKNNYSGDYKTSYLRVLPDNYNYSSISASLEDYQIFFILLAEYSYGDYPLGSKDVLKRADWIEKADSKKRIEAILRHGIAKRCKNDTSIHNLIDPVPLPEKIEDCLNLIK